MSIDSKAKQPNILFLFTDDQRFDTLSALGNSEINTPNMDRLVNMGTTFTHAHIMGGTSGAVCMPSRAMMMTGRTLFSIQAQGQVIPEEHAAMPETMRKAGYTTFHAGKWHQDRASHARCFAAGAKIFGFKKGWYETCDGHWHPPIHDFDHTGKYAQEDGYFSNAPIEPYDPPFTKFKENGKHSSEVFSEAAIDFLRDYSSDNPFFMYVAYVAPHDPRQSPKKFWDIYDPDKISLPPNYLPEHPFDNGELKIRDEKLEKWPRTPEAIRRHIADYYAIISHLDEQIGRILDTLEETGQADNTIIVFAGDNGLAVGQHGLMGKQSVYDHSVRIPLIMGGPGIPKGQKTDSLCYLLDIFPTLCDLTNIPIPDTVEGKSLIPVIQNPEVKIRDILHFAYKGIHRAVRDDRYKLIEYVVDGKRATQLFDLVEDPYEMNNLANDFAHHAHLESLCRQLLKWKDDLGDTQEMGLEFWNGFMEVN